MGKTKDLATRTDAKWLKCIELVAMGEMNNDQVIEAVGMSRATFYDWIKQKEFTDAVLKRNIEVFKGLMPKAIRTVEQCLSSSNQKVRLEAAKLLLDRTLPDFSDQSSRDSPTTVNIQVNYV